MPNPGGKGWINKRTASTAADRWIAGLLRRRHRPARGAAQPAPVYHDGVIYLTRGYRSSPQMALRVGGRGNVFGRNGWRGICTASPVAADGRIYFASETGDMLVIEAGATSEVLARNELSGHVLASPTIANSQIFIRFDR